ncbi:hypothetical protein Q6245_29985, partial [Klebsiella pneumoniae]|uniref:hypothetical protein n=1 Tax=Klebsiella pneumoniae TaxID=573 RepID=UPI0027317F13
IRGFFDREEARTFEIGDFGPDGRWVPWDKKELFFLFCIYWLFVSLAAYAYIGEKVPWLIVHQLLPMILVSVYLMTKKK